MTDLRVERKLKWAIFLFGLVVWVICIVLAEFEIIAWETVIWIGLVCSVPLWLVTLIGTERN
ncbi:hypothetical protein O7608_10560 [Solwaraspora sp. WMMA2056]|uniref:hypothetical protein n=1 Tax=Solwaraspora sp. WMMA2056 TaxID=3015161 RepID=UPI00259B2E28|nr:hypothetical protein [Solwaraspora sp. WMMA2056]WJK42779.1 hypothetical protein O7608_10560 [Solwaraspora sp. WMMA2056]